MSALRMGPRGNRRGGDQKFQTDTEISRLGAKGERPLQAWVGSDAKLARQVEDIALDATSDGRSWNQFAVNQEKFGIVPSYEDRFYTTVINKDHPDFVERSQRAAQLAKEIESQAFDGNVHLAEERGVSFNDSGIDEEDKYSGVDRSRNAWKGHQSNTSFAANEAIKAMTSPTYLSEQEKIERHKDSQRIAKESRANGNLDSGEQRSAKERQPNKEPLSGNEQLSKASDPQTKGVKPIENQSVAKDTQGIPKKKFNFSVAAAKVSSFKSSATPSPHPTFSPIPGSSPLGSVSPIQMSAPMGGRIPMMAPANLAYGRRVSPSPPNAHAPVNYVAVKPTHVRPSPVNPAAAPSAAIDVENLRPLGDNFDFFARNKIEPSSLSRIFFTSPNWSGDSQISYKDQFPTLATMPQRMPMMMPPVGYMMLPHHYYK